MPDWLPVATVGALVLFVVKETVEFFRRNRERSRKKRAIKALIREELRSNCFALNEIALLVHLAGDYEDDDSEDLIVSGHAGRVYYRKVDKNRVVLFGSIIRPVKNTEYQRLLPQAAELDFSLYRSLREGYQCVANLDDLVTSFIEHAGGIPADEKEWFEPFREYAKGMLKQISRQLVRLYVELGGKESELDLAPFLTRDGGNDLSL